MDAFYLSIYVPVFVTNCTYLRVLQAVIWRHTHIEREHRLERTNSKETVQTGDSRSLIWSRRASVFALSLQRGFLPRTCSWCQQQHRSSPSPPLQLSAARDRHTQYRLVWTRDIYGLQYISTMGTLTSVNPSVCQSVYDTCVYYLAARLIG